nr:MAG TPA: S64, SPIDER VENOM PEPTIDE, ICK [Caudoviricetes sp.]
MKISEKLSLMLWTNSLWNEQHGDWRCGKRY